MKLLIRIMALLLVLPLVSASIEITSTIDPEFNLGDSIAVSVKIIPSKTANALVKLKLSCPEKEVPYYIYPLAAEEGKEININTPALIAFFDGDC